MEINVPLLKQICEIAGAPGFEKRIRDMVIELVTPLVDEVKTDNMGSVIAIKKSKKNPDSKKVMVTLDNHVAGCFGMVDGKISQLY